MKPEETDFVMVNGWKRVRLLVRELQQQQNFKLEKSEQQQHVRQDNKQQEQCKQQSLIILRHSDSVRTPSTKKLLRPRDHRLSRHSLPIAFNVNLLQ